MSTGKTYVYRHFDKNDVLLYVGIAANVNRRTVAHYRASPWRNEIAKITTRLYATRIQAAIAELRAINKERPLHNVFPGEEKRAKMVNGTMLSARVPTELVERLTKFCKQKDVSRSDFLRVAIEKGLTR